MKSKRILFLSAIDFKEKSIQIIRKTPEAYVDEGWTVDYLVGRDTSKVGSYFYETEINPQGINCIRFPWPLEKLRSNSSNRFLRTLYTKIASIVVTRKLYRRAKELMLVNHYDIVYGYEIHGVLAVSKLRKNGLTEANRIVNRFQGTWLTKYLEEKNWKKLLLNYHAIRALRQECALCIMTNDGTKGDVAMKKLGKPQKQGKFVFWTNGVDEQRLDERAYQELADKYKSDRKFIFLSVSRLESWKRVDRGIRIFSKAIEKSDRKGARLIIVGDGPYRDKLEQLASHLGLGDLIDFVGAIDHYEVKKYLNLCDAFISMYDLSNVGNPLLEAIRCNKIIFTLNNGDTASWIKHEQNGFIYDLNKSFMQRASDDFVRIINNPQLQKKLIEGIKLTEKNKLWTWEERMKAETQEVQKLVDSNGLIE